MDHRGWKFTPIGISLSVFMLFILIMDSQVEKY
jgi:hypothetical protein